MICKNCGAEYENNLAECPFCRKENEELADMRYQSRIDNLRAENRRIRKLPEIWTKKAGRIIIKAVGITIIAAVTVVAAAAIIHSIKDRRKEKAVSDNLLVMEEYINNRDYAGLSAFYDDIDYASEYSKYSQVVHVYHQYENLLAWLESDETGEYAGECLLRMHRTGEEYLNDNSRYTTDEDVAIILELADDEYLRKYGTGPVDEEKQPLLPDSEE